MSHSERKLKELLHQHYGINLDAKFSFEEKKTFQHALTHVKVAEEEFFLKTIIGSFTWWDVQEDLLKRELEMVEALTNIELRTPDYIVDEIDGRPLILMRKVAGSVLRDETTSESLSATAQALSLLHKRTKGIQNKYEAISDLSGEKLLERLYSWVKDIADDSCTKIFDLLEKQFSGIEFHKSLLHGDANVGNFIIDKDAVTLIDFEETVISDPRIDLQCIYRQVEKKFGAELAMGFLNEYQSLCEWDIGPIQPWVNLDLVRSCLVGQKIKAMKNAGEEIPVFNHENWIKFSDRVLLELPDMLKKP